MSKITTLPSGKTINANNHHINNNNNEDDEVDGDDAVFLGFAEPPDHKFLVPNEFPSKIGGAPVWLDPEHVPDVNELKCPLCDKTMSFLLQLYSPLEDAAVAYHRTLYVFMCATPSCHKRRNGAMRCCRVLRCQLPKDNPYYTTDKKLRKKVAQMPWKSQMVFKEFEIASEPEIIEDDAEFLKEKKLAKEYNERNENLGTAEEFEDLSTELAKDAHIDETIADFQARIATDPDQVIRYCRVADESRLGTHGASPLWISGNGQPHYIDVPRCACGAVRVFEFQVMPQLLYFLGIDSHNTSTGKDPATNTTSTASTSNTNNTTNSTTTSTTTTTPSAPGSGSGDTTTATGGVSGDGEKNASSQPTGSSVKRNDSVTGDDTHHGDESHDAPTQPPNGDSSSGAMEHIQPSQSAVHAVETLNTEAGIDWGVLAVYTCSMNCDTVQPTTQPSRGFLAGKSTSTSTTTTTSEKKKGKSSVKETSGDSSVSGGGMAGVTGGVSDSKSGVVVSNESGATVVGTSDASSQSTTQTAAGTAHTDSCRYYSEFVWKQVVSAK